jgi:hypothetical protein
MRCEETASTASYAVGGKPASHASSFCRKWEYSKNFSKNFVVLLQIRFFGGFLHRIPEIDRARCIESRPVAERGGSYSVPNEPLQRRTRTTIGCLSLAGKARSPKLVTPSEDKVIFDHPVHTCEHISPCTYLRTHTPKAATEHMYNTPDFCDAFHAL